MTNPEDFRELNEWLVSEMYSVPPADRMKYTYAWTMSPEYLAYCRDTLSTHWQPSPQVYAATCLYGYEIEVDEKYGIPKLVRR